ncbi:MAG: DUF2339 domain-containing protein [Patescibacteria group bacterium]
MYFILFVVVFILYFNLRNKVTRLENELRLGGFIRNESPQEQQKVAATPVSTPPENTTMPERIIEPQVSAPIAATTPIVENPVLEPAPQEVKHDDGLEFKFGSKVFTGVGALAIIIGLAFFLSYAFQAGIITETMRVVLGVIVGIVLVGVGYFTRVKYPSYGQVLIGTGLGVEYLSIYSSYNLYNLIDLPVALIGMIIVTAVGVASAVALDSKPLATFAGIGGFLTPYLLSYSGGNPHLLFTYILVLDAGLIALSFYKLWRNLAIGTVIATYLVFITWLSQSYQPSLWGVAEIYLTLFFAGFLAVSLLHYARQKSREDEGDLSLLSLNAGVYFLLSFGLIDQNAPDWMGLFTVVLGLVYFVLWLFVRGQSDRDIRFRSFLAGISFILFIIAVPIQFEKFMITIAWAAQALVLAYLAVKLTSKHLRYLSQTLFTIVFIKLVFSDSMLSVATPFINTRFITFAICLVCFAAAFLVHYLAKDKTNDDVSITNIMMFEVAVIFVAGISLDLFKFFEPSAMTVFWLLSVGILALAAFTTRNIVGRMTMFALLGISLVRILTAHARLEETSVAFINIRSGLLLLAVVISAGIYYLYTTGLPQEDRAGERVNALTLITVEMFIVLQLLFTFEISDFFKAFWLPIVWSLLACAAFFIGLKLKNFALRLCVYITLSIATIRVIFFDSNISTSNYIPVMNGRVLAFVVVAVVMFVIAYVLNRQSESDITPEEKTQIIPAFAIAGNVLLVWVLSKEVLDYFNQQIIGLTDRKEISTLESTKRVALSISWLFYAFILMGISIAKRMKFGRVLAIVLIVMTVFKIFLYDTAELDNFYRFVSYFSLGVLLLVTGFLYNKFKNIIIQFMK